MAALTTAATGSAVAISSSAGASSGAPVNIAWIGFETGAYAQPTRHNDIELAISQINAKGGVDGHKFEYTPYDSGFGASTAVTATQQALASNPTVIMGYSVDDQVQAAAHLLKQSGVPVLAFAEGPAALSPSVHVPNIYTVPANGVVSSVAANTSYAVKTDHPSSVGIFHTDDTASNADAAQAAADLKALGVKNITTESASDTATDATTQAIALKGDKMVFVYGFPLVEATFITELEQNGYTGPIADDQSGDFLAAFGLVKPAQMTNVFYTPYCAPDVLTTPQAQAYTAAYHAAYPTDSPRTATPYAYDATMLLAAAIKKDGGNLSPAALNKAIEDISYKGACGVYHSDVNHELLHQIDVVGFKNGVTNPNLLAVKIEPPVSKALLKKYGSA